jgi:hypothetical protein
MIGSEVTGRGVHPKEYKHLHTPKRTVLFGSVRLVSVGS